MHMGDDRLNLGRLSKMYLDEISGIVVLVNGNKIMWYLTSRRDACWLFNGCIIRVGQLMKVINAY